MSFPLFELVPELRAALPRLELGKFPTPVEPLDAVLREVAPNAGEAWVKRDDLSSPLYGGNKLRALELLFGQAAARGQARIFATGALGSNHALATALHAPRVGLAPGALLFPQPISRAAFLNLKALTESEATLCALPHWSALPLAMARLRCASKDRRPYVMAPGGATPVGALGYVSAGLELGRQVEAGQLPLPRRVIVPVGSTCTAAGLLVGLTLAAHFGLGFPPAQLPQLIAVRIVPWPVTSRFRVLRLAARTARLLHELSGRALPLFDSARLGARLEVDGRYLGAGYGKPGQAGSEAEAIWRRLGLAELDGTYSAKAAARLIAGLRAAEPGPSLFWSTKSSVPLPPPRLTPAAEGSREVPARLRAWLIRAERVLATRRD